MRNTKFTLALICLTQSASAEPALCVASDVSRMSVAPYVSNVDFVAPDDDYLKLDIIADIGAEGFNIAQAYQKFANCRVEWAHQKVVPIDAIEYCRELDLGLAGERQRMSNKYRNLSFTDFYKDQVCGKRDLGRHGNVTIDIITDLRVYGPAGCDAWNTIPQASDITNSLTDVGLYQTCSDFSPAHGQDIDEDGIPDFYDDDIDGDTVANTVDICPHGESSVHASQDVEVDRPGFLVCGSERLEIGNYLDSDVVEFNILGDGQYSSNLMMPGGRECVLSDSETRVYEEILHLVSGELVGFYDHEYGVLFCSVAHENGYSGFNVHVLGPDNEAFVYDDSVRGANLCTVAVEGGAWSHASFSVKSIDPPQQNGCN